MSMLFSSPWHWWSVVLLEIDRRVREQIYHFEWHAQKKIEAYETFCSLYNCCDPETNSLKNINSFVEVLGNFIEIYHVRGQHCAKILQGVTLSDACLLLYGANILFRRVRSKLYYEKTYKTLLGSLGSLRSSLGGLVEFYRENMPGNRRIIDRDCDQISTELGALLQVIKEDVNLVCFFFGAYHMKMYEKMSNIETFEELIPKSDGGKFEECSICMDRRLTHDADVTVLDSCRHLFCSPCAAVWFSTKDRCPMCRTKVKHFASRAQFELFKKRQKEFENFHHGREMWTQPRSTGRSKKMMKRKCSEKRKCHKHH